MVHYWNLLLATGTVMIKLTENVENQLCDMKQLQITAILLESTFIFAEVVFASLLIHGRRPM